MKNILIGITGSIATYKIPELIRNLIAQGYNVKTVLTENAKQFVTPLTLSTVSNNDVYLNNFNQQYETTMCHIDLSRWADMILIAPASANFIAKLATGLADDLLSNLCIASTAPVTVVPAMNINMWNNLATQTNIMKLKNNLINILGPSSGLQACGDIGLGRMVEIDNILNYITNINTKQVLSGINILISAGGTQEKIDPVRYIMNKSTGKMGVALANEAIRMGATVTLIAANISVHYPEKCKIISVTTANEMLNAVEQEAMSHDIFISAAAVSDYKVINPSINKIKHKSNENIILTLTPNEDILGKVVKKYNIFTVGFAAETNNLLKNAKSKLIKKNVNLIVANDISNKGIGFESDYNEVYLVSKENIIKIEKDTKSNIAKNLLLLIKEKYHNKNS